MLPVCRLPALQKYRRQRQTARQIVDEYNSLKAAYRRQKEEHVRERQRLGRRTGSEAEAEAQPSTRSDEDVDDSEPLLMQEQASLASTRLGAASRGPSQQHECHHHHHQQQQQQDELAPPPAPVARVTARPAQPEEQQLRSPAPPAMADPPRAEAWPTPSVPQAVPPEAVMEETAAGEEEAEAEGDVDLTQEVPPPAAPILCTQLPPAAQHAAQQQQQQQPQPEWRNSRPGKRPLSAEASSDAAAAAANGGLAAPAPCKRQQHAADPALPDAAAAVQAPPAIRPVDWNRGPPQQAGSGSAGPPPPPRLPAGGGWKQVARASNAAHAAFEVGLGGGGGGARPHPAQPQPVQPQQRLVGGQQGGGGAPGRGPASDTGFKYQAVVRKKDEREKLQVGVLCSTQLLQQGLGSGLRCVCIKSPFPTCPVQAVECQQCKGFYEALESWGAVAGEPVQLACGHWQQANGQANGQAGSGGNGVGVGNGGMSREQLRQEASRHRYKWRPPATQEGFWSMDLTPPEVQQAQPMQQQQAQQQQQQAQAAGEILVWKAPTTKDEDAAPHDAACQDAWQQ